MGFLRRPDFETKRTCQSEVTGSCSVFQFKNKLGVCHNCSDVMSHCLTCLDNKECIECQTGYRIQLDSNGDKTCVRDCGAGKFLENIESGVCKYCSANCSECKDHSTCKVCNSNYSLNTDLSCDHCDTSNGFYKYLDFEQVEQCARCSAGCKRCEDEITCTMCDDHNGFIKFTQVQAGTVTTSCAKLNSEPGSCLSDEYSHVLTSVEGINQNGCGKCHPSCKTCTGPKYNQCLDCDADRGLFLKSSSNSNSYQGKCKCKDGFYYSSATNSCSECEDPNCDVCTGPGRNTCINCVSGKQVLYLNNCVDCSLGMDKYHQVCNSHTSKILLAEEVTTHDLMKFQADPNAPFREPISFQFELEIPQISKFKSFINQDIQVLDKILSIKIEGMEEHKNFNKIIKFSEKSGSEYQNTLQVEVKLYEDIEDKLLNFEIVNAGLLRESQNPKNFIKIKSYSTLIDETRELIQAIKQYNKVLTRKNLLLVRALQSTPAGDSTSVPPIFIKNDSSKGIKVKASRVPRESKINFALAMGTFTLWFIAIAFCLGGILCLSKFIIQIDIDIHFVKMIIVLEFLARSSLINVNFGYLLAVFLDKLFSFDLIFMWQITDESKFRGSLGGKLDEYQVPVLMINSNLFALSLYLVSAVTRMIVNKIFSKSKQIKAYKFKKAIQSIHFLIMGATILDITFYSGVQIMSMFKVGATVGVVTIFLCIFANVVVFYDIYNLFKNVGVDPDDIKPIEFNAGVEGFESERSTKVTVKPITPEHRFTNTNLKSDANKSTAEVIMLQLINPLYVVRFVIIQYLIAYLQNRSGQVWLIVLTSLTYTAYSTSTLLVNINQLKSKSDALLKILIELCLTTFLVSILVFYHDPQGVNISSGARETWAIISIFAVLMMAVLSLVRTFVSYCNKVQARKKINLVRDSTPQIFNKKKGSLSQKQEEEINHRNSESKNLELKFRNTKTKAFKGLHQKSSSKQLYFKQGSKEEIFGNFGCKIHHLDEISSRRARLDTEVAVNPFSTAKKFLEDYHSPDPSPKHLPPLRLPEKKLTPPTPVIEVKYAEDTGLDEESFDLEQGQIQYPGIVQKAETENKKLRKMQTQINN